MTYTGRTILVNLTNILVTCRLLVCFQKLNEREIIFRNMVSGERLDVLIFGHHGSMTYIHQIGISRLILAIPGRNDF